MKVLITGICGFTGYTLAKALQKTSWVSSLAGVDNLCRPGSQVHLEPLRQSGVTVFEEDIRNKSFLDSLSTVDWVIDAAAQPSVLAGVDGKMDSYELVEHNLYGTINLLEFCKRVGAGFTLLSTSRVYSLSALEGIPVKEVGAAFRPRGPAFPEGFSARGIAEHFSTQAPVSLYGATKLASEAMALEYGEAFGFPVWINRCGVLAGAHQFGHPTQGIFSFWLHSWMHGRPLSYIGFQGNGYQVRDCLHPLDLLPVLEKQILRPPENAPRIVNLSGGIGHSMSLRQLSEWCAQRWKPRAVDAVPTSRKYDLPWIVLDSTLAREIWDFEPQRKLTMILEEIAEFAERHPEWLSLSYPGNP